MSTANIITDGLEEAVAPDTSASKDAMSAPDGFAKSTTTAPPKFIQPNFDRMPSELKLLKNWVLWAAVWSGTKWNKRPIQISGYGASTTNPKHWSSFGNVKQAYEHAAKRGHMELREKGKPVQQLPVGGVGFVFDGSPDENGLVLAGVDFDKVISEGRIAPIAKKRIKRLGSYTELSVSGGGLHVILKARPLKSGIAHDGVEMYTSGRFFTMTGEVL
jgi:putative DNA primase/helicase